MKAVVISLPNKIPPLTAGSGDSKCFISFSAASAHPVQRCIVFPVDESPHETAQRASGMKAPLTVPFEQRISFSGQKGIRNLF